MRRWTRHATPEVPAASGRVTLIQEKHRSAKFGSPAFSFTRRSIARMRTSPIKQTCATRLLGFVYSPYRIDDFLAPITAQKHYDVSFEIFDGTAQNQDSLLFDSRDADPSLRTTFQDYVRNEDVAGRTWTIAYATKPSFEAGSSHRYLKYTLITGAAESAVFRRESRTGARAHERGACCGQSQRVRIDG